MKRNAIQATLQGVLTELRGGQRQLTVLVGCASEDASSTGTRPSSVSTGSSAPLPTVSPLATTGDAAVGAMGGDPRTDHISISIPGCRLWWFGFLLLREEGAGNPNCQCQCVFARHIIQTLVPVHVLRSGDEPRDGLPSSHSKVDDELLDGLTTDERFAADVSTDVSRTDGRPAFERI